MIEDDGARRRLTTIAGHDPDDALTLAALELERRFGRRAQAPAPTAHEAVTPKEPGQPAEPDR